MAERDFLLGDDGEMEIRNGDFVHGDSLTQEVGLLLLTNKGEVRWDPLCGCDLLRRTNARLSQSQFERIVKVQIERDGKNYADVVDGIKLITDG